MRDGEVSLVVVVEGCHGPDVANEVEDDLVEEEDTEEGYPDVSQEVLNIDIFEVSLGRSLWLSIGSVGSGAASCSLHQGIGEVLGVDHGGSKQRIQDERW